MRGINNKVSSNLNRQWHQDVADVAGRTFRNTNQWTWDCTIDRNESFLCLHQAAGFVFTPTDKEKSSKVLHLRYDSTKDQYCRVSNNCELIGRWDECVSSKEAVFRKEENDWQMVCCCLHRFDIMHWGLFVFSWRVQKCSMKKLLKKDSQLMFFLT